MISSSSSSSSMELELGLALPAVSSAHFPNKNFALEINALLEQPPKDRSSLVKDGGLAMEFKNLMIRQKRSFAEAFAEEDGESIKTLSLLVWSGRQPNNEEDGNGQQRKPFNACGNNDEEDIEIVGWPPIKSWMKKLLHGGQQDRVADERANNYISGVRNSIFVKVKMEGVVIGRKIDLALFNCYQALTNSLLNMFPRYRNNGDKDDVPYILSYLDKDGDWLLAGDVPWQIFIESVQRMEIRRQSS